MASHPQPVDHTGHEPSPRWPGFVALLVVGCLYWPVSQLLSNVPPWLMLVIIFVLLSPSFVAHQRGSHGRARWLAWVANGIVTLAVWTTTAVVVYQTIHAPKFLAEELLISGVLVWTANILIFAVWYWEIDGGGPSHRHRDCYFSHDFVFPQMAVPQVAPPKWAPGFTDYLFLAFNTSTAFSPTDTMVLSRIAKVLMMLQSFLSLLVVAVLVARAVNTIGS